MIYEVIRILSPQDASQVVNRLSKHPFSDGKLTAQGSAKDLKHNLQIDRPNTPTAEIDTLIVEALRQSPEFQQFAMPQRFIMPIYSRYEPGMHYGAHVDAALMGGFQGVRTDLAMTLFLSPTSY